MGCHTVWPDHYGVHRSDDWTVNGTACAIGMLLGMAIPAPVAVVESFLLAASVVVMLAMAINTMGLSCR